MIEDTPEARARLDARLEYVTARKEDAIKVLNLLAPFVTGAIITDRYPGADDWHLHIDVASAWDLYNAINNTRQQRKEPTP